MHESVGDEIGHSAKAPLVPVNHCGGSVTTASISSRCQLRPNRSKKMVEWVPKCDQNMRFGPYFDLPHDPHGFRHFTSTQDTTIGSAAAWFLARIADTKPFALAETRPSGVDVFLVELIAKCSNQFSKDGTTRFDPPLNIIHSFWCAPSPCLAKAVAVFGERICLSEFIHKVVRAQVHQR